MVPSSRGSPPSATNASSAAIVSGGSVVDADGRVVLQIAANAGESWRGEIPSSRSSSTGR
jgi:hypothetical protein